MNAVEGGHNVSVCKAVGEQLLCAAYSVDGQMREVTVLNEGTGKNCCDLDKIDHVKVFLKDTSHALVWQHETVSLQPREETK